ncbi:MAG: hypothetical protein CMH30_05490 [Micavibrio sp.]|nr:hypothetical protein [Micavibrio sp.]|tara:strand:+ start:1008 stop:1742 length:735 start_codon:yes stop_codon:yes gene_type:complete
MNTIKSSERGNVLFLILIAVALFAALSYAVTQSSRSGRGDASSETAAVNAATITQYPTGIRTAVLRMTISGLTLDRIEFNEPDDFGTCTTPPGGDTAAACVFHPNGGGATYQLAPASAMATGVNEPWYFNANFKPDGVGLDANPEYMAFLPNITQNLCLEINRRYNIPGTPTIPTLAATAGSIEQTLGGGTGYVATNGTGTGDVAAVAQAVAWPAALDSQAYGCFQNTTPDPDEYVYYHTIVEQ